MPSVVDMGLGGVLNGQQSNFLNDPGVLLGMLSLRERQKARKSDEAYRQERAEVSDRQFERSAGQRDQQIGIQQAAGQRAQASFDRGVKQEDAAGSYFTTLGDEMGLFEQEDPQTGARMGVPEIRQRFEQMSPDDQRRALSFHMEELAQQSEQRKAVEAQMQTQQLLGGFQKQLMGAAETGDLDETMAQMFAERMQGAVTGASGEKPFQVMEDFQAVRQQSMAQRVESERRLATSAPVLEAVGQLTMGVPALHSRVVSAGAAYQNGEMTAAQFFQEIGKAQQVMDSLSAATETGDIAPLLEAIGLSPEVASAYSGLRQGGVEFTVPQPPRMGSVPEDRRMMLDYINSQVQNAAAAVADVGPVDKKTGQPTPEGLAYEEAKRLYEQEFESATGRKIPRAEGAAAPDLSALDSLGDDEYRDIVSKAYKAAKKRLGREPTDDEVRREAAKMGGEG